MNRRDTQPCAEAPLPDFAAVDRFGDAAWSLILNPESWLGHETPALFLTASGDDVRRVVPESEIAAHFAARVPANEANREQIIGILLDADVKCIAHGLSALLSMTSDDAMRLIPDAIRDVIDGHRVHFDHIGIEIFGELEWYIELFDRVYAALDINVVHEHICPSLQVRAALQYDENLGDVRFGRIFFAHDDNRVNLEIFEVEQHWQFIALRQATLYAHLPNCEPRAHAVSNLSDSATVMFEPVGHVAFRVADTATVNGIQQVLLRESRAAGARRMRPYTDKVVFHPADESHNSKFVVATPLPSGLSVDSNIIEIISYDQEPAVY